MAQRKKTVVLWAINGKDVSHCFFLNLGDQNESRERKRQRSLNKRGQKETKSQKWWITMRKWFLLGTAGKMHN